tara:strand:+ start:15262 stop:16902 length:1641 start_codon:yes stop_codon:yes gene_type:complete
MNCKVSCSFGEIIDKLTILTIKKLKAKDECSYENIEREQKMIENDNPQANKCDKLFDKLLEINNKLWELEDEIRIRSMQKKYDENYIKCAEAIHIGNDMRYKIKNEINIKYNSVIKEEKIYVKDNKNEIVNLNEDHRDLEKGKILYTTGRYLESFDYLEKLVIKYDNYKKYSNFYVELLFSYSNICSIFNKKFPYDSKLKVIMNNLESLQIIDELKEFSKQMYGLYCLSINDYKRGYKYFNTINTINGKRNIHGKIVCKDNMEMFKGNDKNKVILLYDGGGIGDSYMYSRFIPILSKKYQENKIIYMTDKKGIWILKKTFEKIKNIEVIGYHDDIPYFDYHCNLLSLIKYLKYTYKTIDFTPLFEKVVVKVSENCKKIVEEMDKNKKTYIFNWKGASKNPHEEKNRKMELKLAECLFKMKNIDWIIVTKEVTNSEMKILKQYKNVKYYGNIIDVAETFIDTFTILRHVDGLISTDTSIVHLSANLNVKTYLLLTVGCEWRWTQNKTTNWYPELILLRQEKFEDWLNVLTELMKYLSEEKSITIRNN